MESKNNNTIQYKLLHNNQKPIKYDRIEIYEEYEFTKEEFQKLEEQFEELISNEGLKFKVFKREVKIYMEYKLPNTYKVDFVPIKIIDTYKEKFSKPLSTVETNLFEIANM